MLVDAKRKLNAGRVRESLRTVLNLPRYEKTVQTPVVWIILYLTTMMHLLTTEAKQRGCEYDKTKPVVHHPISLTHKTGIK